MSDGPESTSELNGERIGLPLAAWRRNTPSTPQYVTNEFEIVPPGAPKPEPWKGGVQETLERMEKFMRAFDEEIDRRLGIIEQRLVGTNLVLEGIRDQQKHVARLAADVIRLEALLAIHGHPKGRRKS